MKEKESLVSAGDKLANRLTSLGHMCSDINQGAISAILPFLVVAYGYDYASVAMVVFAANVTSAFIQPLFGAISDKHPCPWFMALGVFLAGLGMTFIGFVENYWLVLASATLSGVGVALFHPEGGRLSNLAAGARKANGMSIFAVGGNIGFFVGPLLTAAFLSAFGMRGTLAFIFPAAACALVLLVFNKRFKELGVASAVHGDAVGDREHWGRFAGVMGILGGRSIMEYGMLAFVPLFIMGVMGQGQAVSSATLSFFAICCAAATFLSGRVSERVGTHKLMILCLAFTAAMLCVFAFNRSFIAAVALVGLLAVAINLFYPSTVALGMSYVPRHIGTASGLSYGVVVAVGGIAEPFLGVAGDAVGLVSVMLILAAVAVLSMLGGMALCALDRRS